MKLKYLAKCDYNSQIYYHYLFQINDQQYLDHNFLSNCLNY